MTHLDEGTLVALRDGEDVPATGWAHLRGCAECAAALEEAEARARLVTGLLGEDELTVDVAAAKAAVRARLDLGRGVAGPRDVALRRTAVWMGTGMRRAAAILLVTAGAAVALPSSPVRSWLTGSDGAPAETDATVTPAGAAAAVPLSIEVAAVEGLLVALVGVEPGTPVSVVFEDRDGVEIFAGEGTAFSVAERRVDAREVAGPVVVRVPRAAPAITVMVDGRMVFRGTETQAQTAAHGVRADGGWVFRTP